MSIQTTNYDNERAMVATFTGVPVDKIVGPMNPTHLPVSGRKGDYVRISPKTGNPVWATFTGSKFGLFATSRAKAQAKAKAKNPSKKNMRWYGVCEGYALAKDIDKTVLSKV